ncbi:MAG: hypothetical protein ACFFHV_07800 [Promethearchaeota archaeon]
MEFSRKTYRLKISRLEIVKGAGHGLPTDSADILNELIWDFIREHME